jgi:hypothetical protein
VSSKDPKPTHSQPHEGLTNMAYVIDQADASSGVTPQGRQRALHIFNAIHLENEGFEATVCTQCGDFMTGILS